VTYNFLAPSLNMVSKYLILTTIHLTEMHGHSVTANWHISLCGQQYGSDKKNDPIAPHTVKILPAFYGTCTVSTTAHHWSLSWENPVQNAHPISLRLILILSYLLCLGLSSGVLPTGFPSKILYIFLFTPSPDHLNRLDLITQMIFD